LETFGEQLIEAYYGRVQRYVRMRVREQDCEDVVGDIFLRAIERQSQLRGESGPWLFAIARSRIAEHYRSKDHAMHAQESLKENTSAVDGPSAIASRHSAAPLENLEQAEFRELLRLKLNLLPELERDVIALKFTDGLSNAEIARVLEITPNHLGVVLFRALQKLRSSMAENC
jgi:RNA polymerase sigma-70 factor, ECF subfamily